MLRELLKCNVVGVACECVNDFHIPIVEVIILNWSNMHCIVFSLLMCNISYVMVGYIVFVLNNIYIVLVEIWKDIRQRSTT